MRAHYGERAACERCGTDIEFHGKPFRRELLPDSHPGATMTDGGWRDRGGNRKCAPDFRHLHRPYRP